LGRGLKYRVYKQTLIRQENRGPGAARNAVIAPIKAGYTFIPKSRSVTINGKNVTRQIFIGIAN
jgi:hypothetical protein